MAKDADRAGDAAPKVLALTGTVDEWRSEAGEIAARASETALLERAKGVVMAQEHVSAAQAYDRLLLRAQVRGRSLSEECWSTLGRAGSNERPGLADTGPEATVQQEPVPFRAARYVSRDRTLLRNLAAGLKAVRTADEAAEVLRAVFAGPMGTDAVMIYTRAPEDGLDLLGSAGVEDRIVTQWSHTPPLPGLAPLEAIETGKALWLEHPARDAQRHLLIGGEPERWPSRAWLPVLRTGNGSAPVAIGLLCGVHGEFDAVMRDTLLRAVPLVAAALDDLTEGRAGSTAPEDIASVQTMLDALSGPTVLLSAVRSADGDVEDFRIEAAAPGSVDAAGRQGKELVGRTVLETYPTVAGTPLWEGYLETLATGAVYEGEPFAYRETAGGIPHESLYSVRAARLEGRLLVSWMRHDTSDRETRRLDDMQRLGNLGWADWDLVKDTITWSEQVYEIFQRDPELGPMGLDELPSHLVPDDVTLLGGAVERLLAEGKGVDQGFRITTANGVRHLRIVAEARLDVDGTPVEVHGFFQDMTRLREAERALRDSEQAVLTHKNKLQAERNLAVRLQETLLPSPEQSLRLPGLAVEVAYLPADSGVNVGGDWYSAIELSDHDALLVVGDVAGHGLDAVATMAQLRFTAKGMAITGSSLPNVLHKLNTLLLHTRRGSRDDTATATMVMARYQLSRRQLTWARAGHLPPLLIRRGAATFLEQPPGTLLGATAGLVYEEAAITLEPDDQLLFYTDGLVEEPGEDIDTGLTRLAEHALRLSRSCQPRFLAQALARESGERRDDICVMCVHITGDN
ncbi:SpoIIE family protein phosphatase [Streptomyces sp. NBC_00160]|uniref:SpoIIE family protein phosphatase n=1 Tax=Streptomyces sp. NBC_00160 TaxID=2903628 RepID=UPI0022552711|nr:SpoIIE family protein phosphatase [Streptomyces sp. NBC_00160]MCX5309082.1 SpoIIE family protein phosphatase [Streptomyces sp. NBC_00160]